MAYDLWTGADPTTTIRPPASTSHALVHGPPGPIRQTINTTTRPPMSIPLADALLTIGEHPLCSAVEVEQSDDLAIWFHIQNGHNNDYSNADDLATTLATYDQIGTPYNLTVLLPQSAEEYDTEPEGWQSPTINERNSLVFAYA
jgi:hypothetical protein